MREQLKWVSEDVELERDMRTHIVLTNTNT